MAEPHVTRRLAAILAADVVGYSSKMGADEVGTLAALRIVWNEIFNPAVAAHGGRIVKTMGDGALAEFTSAVESVECAVAIQTALAARKAAHPEAAFEFRIGLNLGDIIVEGEDIFGDGVNIAARLQAQAPQGGILASDVLHAQVRGKVAVSFADAGEIALKNIDRPVHAWRWRADGGTTGTPAEAAALPPATRRWMNPGVRPSLAVLPFTAIGGAAEQEVFAEGLVEDIITTLSKLSGLSVIARNSTFVYKGKAVDIRQAARELGVRYVMEGSVRAGGDRLRITVQLVDAGTGVHVWAERYDRRMADLFAIQDEITLRLATELQVKLLQGEQARLKYTTTTNVEAWTYWVQGQTYLHQGPTRGNMTALRQNWEKALALDPDSAPLNAAMGYVHYRDVRFGWWDDRPTALARSRAYLEKALKLDPTNAEAHLFLGTGMMYEGRYDEALALTQNALNLAPGSADVAYFSSWVFAGLSLISESLVAVERSIALNPLHGPELLGTLGHAYRLAGRYDEAIAAFEEYDARAPQVGIVDLVLAYEQAGRHADAVRAAKRVMAARPGFSVARWMTTQIRRDASLLESEAVILRGAGLPG